VETTPTTPTCYRHSDRATRLSCSECGRPICPECSRDAAVGQKCPECSRPIGRATVIDARRTVAAPGWRSSPVAFGLIAVNVVIFLLGFLNDEVRQTLLREGAQLGVLIESGEWYRAFTAMFLHDGITHVLFNMWALYIFGPVLERRFGSVSFAGLYLASGLTGSAAFHLIGQANVWAVGASGAIFGLFGALLAASYRQRHSAAGRAVFTQLLVLLGINMLLPIIVPRIAWEAHFGGLVAGLIIAAAWDRLPVHGPGAARSRTLVALLVIALSLSVLIIG
jgi:membrane associated rhomboid family serine protease